AATGSGRVAGVLVADLGGDALAAADGLNDGVLAVGEPGPDERPFSVDDDRPTVPARSAFAVASLGFAVRPTFVSDLPVRGGVAFDSSWWHGRGTRACARTGRAGRCTAGRWRGCAPRSPSGRGPA